MTVQTAWSVRRTEARARRTMERSWRTRVRTASSEIGSVRSRRQFVMAETIEWIASRAPGVRSSKTSRRRILSTAERATPVAAAGTSSLWMTSRKGER